MLKELGAQCKQGLLNGGMANSEVYNGTGNWGGLGQWGFFAFFCVCVYVVGFRIKRSA